MSLLSTIQEEHDLIRKYVTLSRQYLNIGWKTKEFLILKRYYIDLTDFFYDFDDNFHVKKEEILKNQLMMYDPLIFMNPLMYQHDDLREKLRATLCALNNGEFRNFQYCFNSYLDQLEEHLESEQSEWIESFEIQKICESNESLNIRMAKIDTALSGEELRVQYKALANILEELYLQCTSTLFQPDDTLTQPHKQIA